VSESVNSDACPRPTAGGIWHDPDVVFEHPAAVCTREIEVRGSGGSPEPLGISLTVFYTDVFYRPASRVS
jgi:hypothetical protein